MPTTVGSCGFRLGLAAARGGFGASAELGCGVWVLPRCLMGFGTKSVLWELLGTFGLPMGTGNLLKLF